MRRIIALFAVLALCAQSIEAQGLKASTGRVGYSQVKTDGNVYFDSVGFAANSYRDTITAAGDDTTMSFDIAGLEGLEVILTPIKLVIGTNVTVTPRISPNGAHWDTLGTFALATSVVVGNTYASPGSHARALFLAPGAIDTLVGLNYFRGGQQARIKNATRMDLIVAGNFIAGTDSSIYGLQVRRQERAK